MNVKLNHQELAMVETGMKQIENGQVITHEEACKHIDGMLQKKQAINKII